MGDKYKALSDESRREILDFVSEKKRKAGEIGGLFDISAPAISNHLKILREARLLKSTKRKQNQIYSINRSEIKKIIKFLDGLL